LSEQEQMIRDSIRRIAQEHFKPGAAAADREYRPPVENIKVLADNGFAGVAIPEEYGGLGLGVFELMLIMEEVSRACANTAMLMGGTGGGPTPRVIAAVGTDALKKKFLPKMAKGELFAAWSMSEPNAGSDVGNVQTKAVRDGNEYVINGSKMWCSGAQLADVFLVLVRLDPTPGMKGVGAIMIERGTPGFEVGKHLDLIGLHATGMAPLYFEDCRVPAENVIIPAGGMRKLFEILDDDRVVGNPSICLGVASAALEDALAYTRERKQFGRALTEFQGLQWKLADMAIDLEAGRTLLYAAARKAAAGQLTPMDASVAKVYVNEMSQRVTNSAIQVCGAYGLSNEFPFERYYRDVRGFAIGYGTTEIHRNSIAREMILGNYKP
jgi:alkylation response protein AidB-like acyl-CoA dehydrogenase